MPKYSNEFASPMYREETIRNQEGKTVGTVRIKPSGVLWKPGAGSKYYSVSLDKFTQWITDPNTNATRTKS